MNGLTPAYSGANMQAVLGANSGAVTNVNALWGSNVFWSTQNGNYQIGNIGSSGYGAVWGAIAGGIGISAGNEAQPTTITNTQFLNNTTFFVNSFGQLSLNSATSAYNQTNSGYELNVVGGSHFDALAVNGGSINYGGLNVAGSGLVTGNGWGYGSVVPSCTTAASAGATCTTSITLTGRFSGAFSYVPQCTLTGTFTGVPVIVGLTYTTPTTATMVVTLTTAAVTAAAASASAVVCQSSGVT
jgi:hypothetical protein